MLQNLGLAVVLLLCCQSNVLAQNCNDQCRVPIPFGNVVDPVCKAACERGLPTPPMPPDPTKPSQAICERPFEQYVNSIMSGCRSNMRRFHACYGPRSV